MSSTKTSNGIKYFLQHLSLRWKPSAKSVTQYKAMGSSIGVLDYIENGQLKKYQEKHPDIIIEVEDDAYLHPFVTATYSNGIKKDYMAKKKTADEVNSIIYKLTSTSGNSYGKKMWPTAQDRPRSIQGDWTIHTLIRQQKERLNKKD